jgi:hypothetical protein
MSNFLSTTQRRLQDGQEVDQATREWFANGRFIPHRLHGNKPSQMAQKNYAHKLSRLTVCI